MVTNEEKANKIRRKMALLKKILTVMVKLLELMKKKPVRSVPIKELAEVMAVFEGWNIPNSLCRRNNNPCNLRWSKYQSMTKNGFSFFANKETGWKACIFDLSCKCKGQTVTNLTPNSTLKDLIFMWAPPSDNNNTDDYVSFVCRKLKVKPSYKLKNFKL